MEPIVELMDPPAWIISIDSSGQVYVPDLATLDAMKNRHQLWPVAREIAVLRSTPCPDLKADNAALVREAANLLVRIDRRVKAGDWVLSGDDSKALFHTRNALAALQATEPRP